MEHRRENRYRVWAPVILTVPGTDPAERQCPADLVDISKSGLRVVVETQLELGIPFRVDLGHLAIEAIGTSCEDIGNGEFAIGAEISSLQLTGTRHSGPKEGSRGKQRPLAGDRFMVQ